MGSNSVGDFTEGIDGNTAQGFVANLTGIFAHTKKDIIDFCESLELNILLEIRQLLYQKLIGLQFMTDELELCNRHKKSALADDIYVIGYSVVSEQEHKRLKKVLKSKTDAGDITLTQGEPVNPTTEDSELLVMCHSLREQVWELLSRVASLSSRVESLESELTGLKILRLDDRKRNEKEKIKSDVHEISKNVPVPIINPLKKSTLKVTAEVHNDINGIPQVTNKINTLAEMNKIESIEETQDEAESIKESQDEAEDISFRHTSMERRNILRKNRRRKKLSLHNRKELNTGSDVIGNSDSEYKIKAATNHATEPSHTFLVYIGKLAKETDEQLLRTHLRDIGIKNADIADVMKLKCKANNETSFCVSLNSEEAKCVVFDINKWPIGVRIRTFYRANYNRETKAHQYKTGLHHRNQEAPR